MSVKWLQKGSQIPPPFSAKTNLRIAALIVYTSAGKDGKKLHLKTRESLSPPTNPSDATKTSSRLRSLIG